MLALAARASRPDSPRGPRRAGTDPDTRGRFKAGTSRMGPNAMTADLVVKDLHVSVEGKEILKGLSLEIRKGEIHALMGPNGSGKSTFANTLMGHPRYEVTSGEVLFDGQNLLEMEADERSRAGLFMAFQ